MDMVDHRHEFIQKLVHLLSFDLYCLKMCNFFAIDNVIFVGKESTYVKVCLHYVFRTRMVKVLVKSVSGETL